MCNQCSRFFARMRTAGNPDEAIGMRRAKCLPRDARTCGYIYIEFDIAGNLLVASAQLFKARIVLGCLGGVDVVARQNRPI